MDFPKHENAKWAQAANAAADQYAKARREALEESAALGFAAPSGPALERVMEAGLEVKGKLTEANARIYQEERERLFKLQEMDLKLALGWARLALKAYQQALLNRLAIEEAEAEAAKTRTRGDLERLNAETESRQADIIRLRADIEGEINYWRRQLVEAERLSLDAEAALINARMLTAEEKLKTIDPIYEVIAAQELTIKAELKKAAALELVAEAEKRVAEVKKQMVPLYLEKAAARETLAEAVIREAEVEKARIELGYDRLALKDAQEAAEEDLRQAQIEHELAQEAYVRAEMVRQTAAAEARTLLARYANETQEALLDLKLALDKLGVDFKLDARLKRLRNDVEADIALLKREGENQWEEFLERLIVLERNTLDRCHTIRDGASTVVRSSLIAQSTQWHRKGVAGLPNTGGTFISGNTCPEAG
ncbi:MAG: hypothetical protein QME75_12395 [Deltaproteobacteria bacterium]|nr:hypothetical protein [Deltaproteobacteria bacterium]